MRRSVPGTEANEDRWVWVPVQLWVEVDSRSDIQRHAPSKAPTLVPGGGKQCAAGPTSIPRDTAPEKRLCCLPRFPPPFRLEYKPC